LAFKNNKRFYVQLNLIIMKKQIYRLILIMVPIMLLFSCKKDKFSEKDALDAQQTIDLLVTVIDASSSLTPVPGATVTAIIDSTAVTKTTNASGAVVFSKVNIGGSVTISIAKANYTSVLTSVNTNPESYRQTQVSAIVSVYSLDPTKLATIKGRLTMQSDLTDRNREPAVGFIVKARNNDLKFTSDQLFTATTDADGKYSISVPVSSKGDNIALFYPEFTVNQKLAFVQEDKSVAVAERSVLYVSDSYPVSPLLQYIPAIPSIYATIAAPATTALGSGFALGTKANRVPLSSYSGSLLINGGAGYNGGVTLLNYQLSFSPDPSGTSAKLQVDIIGGKIANIDFIIDNGALYSAPPTLNVNVLAPTTPANIAIGFQTTYKLYISNKGTNYLYFPIVSVETESYADATKVKAVDPNINDNSNQVLGVSNLLSSYSIIYGGLIRSNLSNGDTLLNSTVPFSAAPVFTIADINTRRAVLSVGTGSINADSTLSSITLSDGGLGYNPTTPPVVTITTLGGYGSGAIAKAIVNTSGSVSAVYVTNPGKKYVRNVNDFRNTGVTGPTYDLPSFPNTNFDGIKPGEITVQDVYYGTGSQILNQNSGK
jgi:hypothetical protein